MFGGFVVKDIVFRGAGVAIITPFTEDGINFDGSADVNHYATCSTAAATTTKTVNCSNFKLTTGSTITVKFTTTNTAAVGDLKLNVQSTGAKAIKYRNANLSSPSILAANRTYKFVYDGSYWQIVGDLSNISDSDTNGNILIDGTETTVYTHPTYSSYTGNPTENQTPGFGSSFTVSQVKTDSTGHVSNMTSRTITIPSKTFGGATSSSAGTIGLVPSPVASDREKYLRGNGKWESLPSASTTASGIVQLSSAVDSNAGYYAATSSAVKQAYDLANSKSTVSFTRSLTSGTKIGSISINGTSTDIYCEKDTDTWTPMTGATSSANGTVGYVNAVPPKDGYNTKYLRADGTWAVPTDTDTKVTQSNATGNTNRPLLLSHDSITVIDDATNVVYRNAAIYANPSTGTVTSNAYTAYNGDITIRKETSIADDLPATLKFTTYQTDNQTSTPGAYIRVYDDHDTSSAGSNMLIQSGGNVVIGGGEAPSTIYSSLITSSYLSHEHLFLTSDNGIKIVLTDSTDVTDVSKYKTFELNNSGNFYQTTSEAYDNDGFGAIGVKSRRFYEGSFHHINVTTGVHYHKGYSNGTEDTFPLIYFNTSNIWIGSTGTSGAQHRGTLNLSAGFDVTNNVPYESATVAVANSDNTAATPYHILHKGNTSHILTSSDDAWSSVGVPLTSGYIFKVLRVGKGTSAPTPPEWAGSKYDNGLVVGLEDGKMLITAGQSTPRITFAGGHNSSTVTKPEWYFKLTGTNGTTYNLDTHHPTIEMESDTGSTDNLNHNETFITETVERDDNGHVISTNAKTYTLIANKVTQKNTTSNTAYRLLLSYAANDTEVVNTTFKNSQLTFNPSTAVLTAGNTVRLHAEDSVATVTSADVNISADIINDGDPIIDITYGTTHAGVKASSFYGELDGTISSDTTATTQSVSDSSTKVATTKFVKDVIDDSRVIHTATGTVGTAGWIKIATIKHTKTYNNGPIMLTIAQRGGVIVYRLHIRFKNTNSTDPDLDRFMISIDTAWQDATASAYLIKSATSTWDLYIKKLDNSDHIGITGFDVSEYSIAHMTWTWTDVQTAASAITGGTAADKTSYVTTDSIDNLSPESTETTSSSTITLPAVTVNTIQNATFTAISNITRNSDKRITADTKNTFTFGPLKRFTYQQTTRDNTWEASGLGTDTQNALLILRTGWGSTSGQQNPSWTPSNNHGVGLAVANGDKRGYIGFNAGTASVPEVSFAAGTSTATSTTPGWYFKIKGTTETIYELNRFPSFYVVYNNASGTSTSVTTSSAYTQTFAYFKVFIYNTAQSTTHVVDINGSAGYNQICIGWGMSPSSTSYYRTTNASILTSVSSNKYTFALTIGYTIQASSSGNATATTNPTLYIRKIIGFVC